MFKLMLMAGAGGFVGTCCRFLINRLFAQFREIPFPLATFIINILGCLAFGILSGWIQKTGILTPKLNALLIVGFCGGFTTFSTFSYETLSLGMNGEVFVSFIYIALSVIIGLFATWLGFTITT